MPLKTLNKIAATFVVGGAALLVAIALYWNVVSRLSKEHLGVLAVLFIPMSALLGTIVQSLCSISLGRFLRGKAHSRNKWVPILGQAGQQDDMMFWKQMFLKFTNESARYSWLRDFITSDDFLKSDLPKKPRFLEHQKTSAAFGAFLRDAKADEFEWYTQERAGFIVASSLAFTLGLSTVYALIARFVGSTVLPSISRSEFGVVLFISFIGFWALCSFAIARYLFEYEIVLRHICLLMTESETQADSEKTKAANA